MSHAFTGGDSGRICIAVALHVVRPNFYTPVDGGQKLSRTCVPTEMNNPSDINTGMYTCQYLAGFLCAGRFIGRSLPFHHDMWI